MGAEIKGRLGSGSELLLVCAALLAPFAVRYQIVEWGGSGIPEVNLAFYSPAFTLYMLHGAYGSWSGLSFYVGPTDNPMQLVVALLGVVYASAILSVDDSRNLAIAQVSCGLSLVAMFCMALLLSLVGGLIIPPGFSYIALELAIRDNLCLPIPLLVLICLPYLRRRPRRVEQNTGLLAPTEHPVSH